MRQQSLTTVTGLALASCLLVLVGLCGPVLATEGGTGHYIQGSYGDYLMGVAPAPGFSFRNDTVYLSQTIDKSLVGGRVYGKINASSVIDLLKFSYVFDADVLGGRAGFGAIAPIIVNTNVGGDLNAFDPGARGRAVSKGSDGSRGGLSDLIVMPVILGWDVEEIHVAFMPLVYLPTGYYNKKDLNNLGMNYFSFDPNVSFTWLSKRGCELSLNAGYMVNTENTEARYLSGNQFHLDWTAAYHVNERLALGVVGYVVAQTTPDSGKGARLGGFYSSGVGIGPSAAYTVPIGGKNVTFIAKWLHDLGAENRLKGEAVYGSFAVTF